MRRVYKAEEPDFFRRWKDQANENWTPNYAEFRAPEKPKLHELLIEEQHRLCCYCGRAIDTANSHIEHFRPQESFPSLALAYSNLFASCLRELSQGTPLHCGHAKGARFDDSRAIAPTDDCEPRFSYSLDGQILASTDGDGSADYMIQLLQLNVDLLKRLRSEALLGIFSEDFLADFQEQELRLLISSFEAPGEEFGHVVVKYCRQQLGLSSAD